MQSPKIVFFEDPNLIDEYKKIRMSQIKQQNLGAQDNMLST